MMLWNVGSPVHAVVIGAAKKRADLGRGRSPSRCRRRPEVRGQHARAGHPASRPPRASPRPPPRVHGSKREERAAPFGDDGAGQWSAGSRRRAGRRARGRASGAGRASARWTARGSLSTRRKEGPLRSAPDSKSGAAPARTSAARRGPQPKRYPRSPASCRSTARGSQAVGQEAARPVGGQELIDRGHRRDHGRGERRGRGGRRGCRAGSRREAGMPPPFGWRRGRGCGCGARRPT
jgi:hypothetical protein